MISNDAELESTKIALDHAEKALIALKNKVFPLNPQKYYILSKPYLEYINRLRVEKDEYIGLSSAEEQWDETDCDLCDKQGSDDCPYPYSGCLLGCSSFERRQR